MRSKYLLSTLRAAALTLAGALAAGTASAQTTVHLQAVQEDIVVAGSSVPMWVFRCAPGGVPEPCVDGPISPTIRANPGALTIFLANQLGEPVSVVIPGQTPDATSATPVFDADGRVRSFAKETAAGSSDSYSWPALKPGAYLLRSGSEPAVQVQMGLYGALVVEDTSTADDDDAVLLFSEIDPQMHAWAADVAAGTPCEDPNLGIRCSTLDYSPRYYLINGRPYEDATPPPPIDVTPGATNRLRLLNAGQTERVAMLGDGLELTLRLEDGFPIPIVKTQASALLAPGKAFDADVAIPALEVQAGELGDQTISRSYPVYDRRLGLTNDNEPRGGALAYLVATGDVEPTVTASPQVAVDKSWLVDEGSALTSDVLAGDTVVGALEDLVIASQPQHGTLAGPGTTAGEYTYTPAPGFTGSDSFAYYFQASGSYSNVAVVSLDVSNLNDLPVAAADAYTNTWVGTLTVEKSQGLLANDSDADGDVLLACLTAAPVPGLTAGLDADGCFDGTFSYTGSSASFSYAAWDGTVDGDGNKVLSAAVDVDVTMNTTAGPTLVVQSPTTAVTEYRWVLEADPTFHPEDGPDLTDYIVDGQIDWASVPMDEVLALSFHRSYAPVLAQGCVGAGCDEVRAVSDAALPPPADPARPRHFFVSVLPLDAADGESGHTLGGAGFASGAGTVTVRVNDQPEPPAQISIVAFEDNHPTNGTFDPANGERLLPGFQIILEDAGGRYGASAGLVLEDKDGLFLRNALCPGEGQGVVQPGVILTCPEGHPRAGEALIQNLVPAKYGVLVAPPAGDTNAWVQTSTIEGKKVIDAWVKAGEPPYFQEFGPPGYHVFVGFVKPNATMPAAIAGTNSVTGRVTNLHMSRPPDQTLWDSGSHDALAHSPAWVGVNLDGGVGFNHLAVEADPETGEFSLSGLPDGTHQLVVWDKFMDTIIAYRNLVLPCESATCDLGDVPVFNWFARTEQSVFEDLDGNGIRDEGEAGMLEQGTNIRWRDGTLYQSFPTDLFGEAPYDEVFPFFHWLVAEVDFARYAATGLTVQVDSGGDASIDGVVGNASWTRTETGPVLTEGFQAFLGQTNRFAWGKRAYEAGENGGISGMVIYATTRAEDDPGLAAAEPWEPGIPRVTVRLYRKLGEGVDGPILSLVDETQTDSWDDSLPDGCPGNTGTSAFEVALGTRCYDGIRNFNQARPAVYDGGFAFDGLEPGDYVVEVVPPPGYEILKEEDKNVDFGSAFQSAFVFSPDGTHLAVPDAADVRAAAAGSVGAPECVGELREVPAYLSLFPDQMLDAPFATYQRPLCDRQEVVLTDRSNAGAEFFLLTQAPIAGHLVGMILDDTAVEFNQDSPNFGEKWAPPEMPVSIRDSTGTELSRVYADQWGRYDALVPSTFTMNAPMSSGASPAMLTTCMNDAVLPGGGLDPKHDPRYSTFCYTFQYMPGTTTYLDTPVLPLSAFAAGDNPVDCAFPDGTPRIASVTGDVQGPWVRHGSSLTIDSVGLVEVPNPAYTGPTGTEPRLVERDFRFGGQRGRVLLQGVGLPYEIPVANNDWKQDQIVTGALPADVLPGSYQLVVERADDRQTVTSVTVTVAAAGAPLPSVVTQGESIQAAIDGAAAGDLVLVAPGTYLEPVIVSKPVKLQGAGEATVINARPFENFDAWYQKLETLYANGTGWAPAPGQEVVFGGLEPDALLTESVPVVTVVAQQGAFTGQDARVDGFTLTGAEVGGGVFVNGWAHDLEISNNRIANNGGFYAGGIRVGHFTLDQAAPLNSDVRIHHNAITQNGAFGGVGGGVSLCSGSDGYLVADNWICGNFTQGDGAGIGHHGRSDGGRIERNHVVFNQSFNQGLTRHGGGIIVNGIDAATGGSGAVAIDANQIQGNHAAAGDGAGIRIQLTADPVEITNNMVVNNVAGGAGGGISVLASGDVSIVNNTVAHNDSTATVGAQFTTGTPDTSTAVAAGVVADAVSAAALVNNVIWENRSFRYMVIDGSAQLCPGDTADGATSCSAGDFFDDLGGNLTPTYSVLTDTTGFDPSNTTGDPGFVESYFNQARSVVRGMPEATTLPIDVAPALDEGGNFIEVRYGPITLTRTPNRLWGDYHIDPPLGGGPNAPPHPALDNADASVAPATDFDGDLRPIGDGVDRGADEVEQ